MTTTLQVKDRLKCGTEVPHHWLITEDCLERFIVLARQTVGSKMEATLRVERIKLECDEDTGSDTGPTCVAVESYKKPPFHVEEIQLGVSDAEEREVAEDDDDSLTFIELCYI